MHNNFKHNNNIDKVVKDALEDYEMPFKEDDWLFLAEGLTQQDKYLAMLSKQRWMTGIAALLILTAGFTLYAALHFHNPTTITITPVESLTFSDLHNKPKNEINISEENKQVLIDKNQLNKKQHAITISSYENQTRKIIKEDEHNSTNVINNAFNNTLPISTKDKELVPITNLKKGRSEVKYGASLSQHNLAAEQLVVPEINEELKTLREFPDLVTVPTLSVLTAPLMEELLPEQSEAIMLDLPIRRSPRKKELATKIFIEANFVNENQKTLGFSVGNSAGIRSYNQHWLFETGLYYGHKRFLLPERVLNETFSIGNQNIPATIIVTETNLDMVEIPFNIKYQVNLVKRHKPFIGIGTSVYLPLYESHLYDIEAIEPINGVEVESAIINLIDDRKVTKKFYAGIFSVNLGSSYQVNERIGIHWAANYKTSLTKKSLNQPLQVNAYYLRTMALELGFQYHF